jgi:phenylpropionate dioxygenase-like ring-hydroxylating dioxygenase large terminal subunit
MTPPSMPGGEGGEQRDEAGGRYRIARLRNRWYVACRSSRLGSRPLAVTILDTPLVLFRAEGGRAAALLDRCAHRNLPLSLGRSAGPRLACRYHGWEFDGEGICRRVPALCAATEGPARRVPAFPAREAQGFVWVFLSETAAPDSEPFRFPHLDEAGFGSFRIDYRVDATLHATLENMLDVPHTAFLHRGLFRGGGRRNRITAVVRRSADRVEAEYVGEPLPSGLAARILGVGESDRDGVEHFDRFILPSISQVEYRLGNSHLIATSALTPESDFVTRFSTVVSYRLPLPRLLLRALFEPVARRILGQDAWVLARQTRAVRAFGGEEYASTEVDVLGREIWRLLKAAEKGDTLTEQAERRIELEV